MNYKKGIFNNREFKSTSRLPRAAGRFFPENFNLESGASGFGVLTFLLFSPGSA
jgi:hypothetical protein